MDSLKLKKSCSNAPPPKEDSLSNQPAYLIVHAMGETTLSKRSPFLIQKLFESTIGHLKKIQKLRSGDLLVEAASPQQSEKLMKTKSLGDIEVTITPHTSLNSSRGVISEIDLMSEDESDIQIGLSDQGVTAVRRISIRRDVEGHQSTECTSTPCCVNCNDAHPAYSRKCSAWQREKEIQRVKTVNNVSYPEARRMVTLSAPLKQKSFAAALKSTKTIGVQTDISVSPKESLTRHAKCLILPSQETPAKESTKAKTPLPKPGVITRNLGSKKASKNPLNKQRVKAALSKSKKLEAQSMSEFSDFSEEETHKEVTKPMSPPKEKLPIKLKRDTLAKNAASNT
ncbi:uncharacterized protein LOC111635228 [Centruroides sculpturatus]|uniref:uncharacterized protein LOC111635228 n=1 Tax=Centruroides sculpturatus TaxID=218467 RepID=UPI000C6DD210|nr:uncharacterized protein LOC111635228 [Centruroides sculpturatus]